jgi:DNA-binding response OmpR family regulator
MTMAAIRVLLLEYDAILCDLLKLSLQRNGYMPIICDDPVFAIDEIEECQPEILIIDTCLPRLNAFDLLHEINEKGLLDSKYVVILSALGFPSIVKQAKEAGADDFLVKPLDVETLVSKIMHHQRNTIKNIVSAAPVHPL